jgi:hypothetical protein
MLIVAAAFWILATIPLRLGSPWSQVSFASGYGAILMTAISAAKIIALRFGLLWSHSFASGYSAILMTGITLMKSLMIRPGEDEQGPSFREASSHSSRGRLNGAGTVMPCATCAVFSEFTTDFTDIVPKVEAIYLEHLEREHGLNP